MSETVGNGLEIGRDDHILERLSKVSDPPSSTESFQFQEVNNLDSEVSDSKSETTDLFQNNNSAEKHTSKSKRNVKFPSGSMVLGFLEPPNPWRNVISWTTSDLILAYRKGCENHAAKPLNKVLQQLQGIENSGQRFQILSLKGERLDLRHCEALEEVLKLVQFHCLDLEATHLDDETAAALFEMVEYYESACKINISFNKNISARGWQACSRMIRKTPCLNFLDARNCDLNERVIPILGRALRMGCFLTTLHLESTMISGRSMVILVAALKMNDMLTELFLADNKLTPTDGIQIGNLLKYNHKIQLLDIRNNSLQDIGVGHICDGLVEQTLDTGLLTLVLWCNQLSYQSMSAMSKALTSNVNLETLNLGHNSITNEGIHLLKEGLLLSRSLLRLGLQGTKVTCEGAIALAEVIADSPRLLRMDLRENEIKTAGMMALSLALKMNETLTRLDLDRETKKESGVRDFADQQKRLQKDISSYTERNRMLIKKGGAHKHNVEKETKEEGHIISGEDNSSVERGDLPFIQHTVRRPSLLAMNESSAEDMLDSPSCTREIFLSPVLSQSLVPTPPGELLLSPQYMTEIKAKKIFTVSKVDMQSMLSPPTPSVSSPVLPTSGNLEGTKSVLSAGLHKRGAILSIPNIPSQVDIKSFSHATLVDPPVQMLYSEMTPSDLQNLLINTSGLESSVYKSDEPYGESDRDSEHLDNNAIITKRDTNHSKWKYTDLQTESVAHSFVRDLLLDLIDSAVCDKCQHNDKTFSNSNSISICQYTKCEKSSEIINNSVRSEECGDLHNFYDSSNSTGLYTVLQNTRNQTDDKQGSGSVENSSTNNCTEKSHDLQHTSHKLMHDLKSHGEGLHDLQMMTQHTVTLPRPTHDLNSIRDSLSPMCNLNSSPDSGITITSQRPVCDIKSSTGSGIGSTEQWTQIDSSEIPGSTTNSHSFLNNSVNSNPNFHSTLTMNGLTQELASVLESIESDKLTEHEETPDEFECELDAMLASVQCGGNIPAISCVRSETQESTILP